MSAIRWTKEQERVIKSRNKNVLVSAAAGSGKTAVLSARIVDRILDRTHPIDVDKLLVVTFTNAAAAEMRERIARAITEALDEDPGNTHLQKQTTLLHHAQITTYDSFCLYLIRNYFYKIDLAPGFRVADPGEIKLLQTDVLDQVFAEFYAEAAEDFTLLIEGFSGRRSDEPVRAMVLMLAQFAGSYPWESEWLSNCLAPYEAKTAEELLSSNLMQTVLKLLQNRIRGLSDELSVCAELAGGPDGPQMYAPVLLEEAEELREIAETEDFLLLGERIAARESKKLPPARGFAGDSELKDFIQVRRRKVKEVLDKLYRSFYAVQGEALLPSLHRAGATAGVLVRMTERFLTVFREAKREKNLVDFSDLEHFALQILVDPDTKEPTDVAESYRREFEEILVDEYQDSNYLQEAILGAIARQEDGRKNLFFVGDVKQSIYRFRLARPELFLEKYHAYEPDGLYEERIDLHKNFRSRAGILSAVNDFFFRLMGEDLGMIDYDAEAALNAGASYPKNPEPPVRILLTDAEAERLKAAGEPDRVALEGRLIAREIKRLTANGSVTEEETGALRPVRYSDIVILLRSPGSTGDTLRDILSEYGIPAVVPTDTGYFDTTEVRVLLSLLAVIDNPRQDIPLTAVLRSPIVGLSDDALAKIRMEDRDAPFYECARMSERTAEFFARLSDFRDRAVYLRVHELIEYVLKETGYLDIVSAMPGGAQRAANLNMLIEKAIAYERTSYHGLYHFIRYIENIRKYQIDFGEADLASGSQNAVRILSIHKSKGLEFPVVFVSLLGKEFNRSDSREKLLIHPSYGIGTFDIDGMRRTKQTTILREAIKALGETEDLGEELRVLYVALTRAKEKLILTGSRKDAEAYLAQLEKTARPGADGRLSYEQRIGASRLLDWIIAAACSYENKYNVEFISPEEIVNTEKTEDLTTALTREAFEEWLRALPPIDDDLRARMDYTYPYAHEKDIRTKVSVSDLKHQAMLFSEGEAEALEWVEKTKRPRAVPSFASDGSEENRGALRGSAVHRVMECIDFATLPPLWEETARVRLDWAKTALLAMKAEGRITEAMYELVRPELIAEFLGSALSRRMCAAAKRGELYKEKPFVMGLPAAEVYHLKSEETVLVQGIIDVFFREGEEYVIMDYKTDSVKEAKSLIDRYRAQLTLYADAVERNKKARVREKLIYSFHLGETITV